MPSSNTHGSLDSAQLAYVCLSLVPGVGPKTLFNLQQQGISASHVFTMDSEQLALLGLNDKVRSYIVKHPPSNPGKYAEQCLTWAQQDHHHLITPAHHAYPEQLKQIATAPGLLMVKGQLQVLSLPQIAIVGSRYPSESGKAQAMEFAAALADMGLVITSGLALGIDGHAHQGALSRNGATVAVLGTGIERIYPRQHQALAEELQEKGALLSEFNLHAQGKPGHFPRRNRIVSGLSLATLVVEANLKSGSLITARQALEQNREVFAIPGAINSPHKKGCHHLIRQGAILVDSPEQIIEELGLMLQPSSSLPNVDHNQHQLSSVQQGVLKALDYEGTDLDQLMARTQLAAADISVQLMELELSGLIRQEGGLYARI